MITLQDIIEEGSLDPNNHLDKLSFLRACHFKPVDGTKYSLYHGILKGDKNTGCKLSSRTISIWTVNDIRTKPTSTWITLSLLTGHMELTLRTGLLHHVRDMRADIEDMFKNFPYVEESELELIEMLYPGLNTHMIRYVAEAERKSRTQANPEEKI